MAFLHSLGMMRCGRKTVFHISLRCTVYDANQTELAPCERFRTGNRFPPVSRAKAGRIGITATWKKNVLNNSKLSSSFSPKARLVVGPLKKNAAFLDANKPILQGNEHVSAFSMLSCFISQLGLVWTQERGDGEERESERRGYIHAWGESLRSSLSLFVWING